LPTEAGGTLLFLKFSLLGLLHTPIDIDLSDIVTSLRISSTLLAAGQCLGISVGFPLKEEIPRDVPELYPGMQNTLIDCYLLSVFH
jgi:hypothetical protein